MRRILLSTIATVAVLASVPARAQEQAELPPCRALPCPSGVAQPVAPVGTAPVKPVVDPVLVEQRGRAFIYIALVRHEAECPTPRTEAFKAARKAMLFDAALAAVGVPTSVMMWQHEQLDQLRATPGPWCRLITGLITDRQVYLQRLTSE